MGGVPVKHHSKSKVGRRRSQLKLKSKNPIQCSNCGWPTLPHSICSNCGIYFKKEAKKENRNEH